RAPLADDVPHPPVPDKAAELADDVIENFAFVIIAGIGDLLLPVAAYQRVFNRWQQTAHICGVTQRPHHFDQSAAFYRHHGEHGVPDVVLEARPDNALIMWV